MYNTTGLRKLIFPFVRKHSLNTCFLSNDFVNDYYVQECSVLILPYITRTFRLVSESESHHWDEREQISVQRRVSEMLPCLSLRHLNRLPPSSHLLYNYTHRVRERPIFTQVCAWRYIHVRMNVWRMRYSSFFLCYYFCLLLLLGWFYVRSILILSFCVVNYFWV